MRRIFFYPLFLTGNKRLEPRGHAEPQLVYERRLVLTVDLNFDPSFKGRLICRTMKKVSAVKLVCFSPHTGGCWFNSLTCLSPDWQVLVLLNVQHDLQAVTHTSFGGDQRRTSITSCIKGITLPIASKHLRHRRRRIRIKISLNYF